MRVIWLVRSRVIYAELNSCWQEQINNVWRGTAATSNEIAPDANLTVEMFAYNHQMLDQFYSTFYLFIFILLLIIVL